MTNLRIECAKIFSKVMMIDEKEISANSSPENLEAWDSLAHIQLISDIEEAFSIEISPEEGIELETFKNVLDFVEKKLTGKVQQST